MQSLIFIIIHAIDNNHVFVKALWNRFTRDEVFVFFRRMINTGRGGRRTTWRRSARATPGVWKRTRSPSAPSSWSEKTRRCDGKWPRCAKTAAAARRSCRFTKPNTARCEGRISLSYTSHGRGLWVTRLRAGREWRERVFLRGSWKHITQHNLWPPHTSFCPLHDPHVTRAVSFRGMKTGEVADGKLAFSLRAVLMGKHDCFFSPFPPFLCTCHVVCVCVQEVFCRKRAHGPRYEAIHFFFLGKRVHFKG